MGVGRVALTGGIATGKSTVLAVFRRCGVPTIDADVLARDAVAPGTPGLAAVVDRFGPSVVNTAGVLDRQALARIVFADEVARRALEAIVHPIVRAWTTRWFTALEGEHAFGVADIPLLYEVGRDRDFDAVVVAACDPSTQVRRLRARDGLTEEDALGRIRTQWPIAEKIRRADYVVRTDKALQDTERAAEAVCADLRRRTWA